VLSISEYVCRNNSYFKSYISRDDACFGCGALTPFLWGFEEREKL